MTKFRLSVWLISSVCFMLFISDSGFAQVAAHGGTIEAEGHVAGAFDLYGPRPVAGFAFFQGNPPVPYFATVKDAGQRKVQPVLGGNGLVSINKFLWAYGSFNWVPKEEREATASREASNETITPPFTDQTSLIGFQTTRYTVKASRRYLMGLGGLQFTLPTITRVVPYFQIGGGVIHYKQHESQSATGIVLPQAPCQDEAFFCGGERDVTFQSAAVHFGGGIRYFRGENWGIRFGVEGLYLKDPLSQRYPDFSATRATAIPTVQRSSFGFASFGMFKQWQ